MADPELIEKAHEVVVAGQRLGGTSTQKDPDALDTPEHALEPPLPLESLARLSQTSSVRKAIIDAISRNTVGLGYDIEVAPGAEEDVADHREESQELTALLEGLAGRDIRLEHPSFTELLMAVKTDEEEVGWGFVEVSRSRLTGRIDGLFHVPGKHMRRLKDRTGYILLDPGTNEANTEFYNFGEKVEYGENDEPTATLANGKGWGKNEVIVFRLYTSESRDYGLPRDASLALEYAGDKLAAEYNVSFFDAGGTPPTILFIHASQNDDMGQRTSFRVPQATVQRVANTIKSDGGHRDRVSIIPLPANSEVDKVVLGETSDRDMGFVNFRADNTSRFLSAFRVAPIFIGVETEGRYDAETQRALTLEQVFDPEQDRYEQRINLTIIKDLGYADLAIHFKRMAVEGDKVKRDSATSMAEGGSITRREYRASFGYGPLPEAAKGAEPEIGQVPYGWNDEIVDTGKPKGAENREPTDDTRGLKPGVGQRDQKSTDEELDRQKESGGGTLSVAA